VVLYHFLCQLKLYSYVLFCTFLTCQSAFNKTSVDNRCGNKPNCPSARKPLLRHFNPLMSLEPTPIAIQAFKRCSTFFATSPVTTSTTVKSFSALKFINNYLHSTITSYLNAPHRPHVYKCYRRVERLCCYATFT